MLKAIETTYNGYRFRSRTEARWAVFFDACRIEYEYEKEGFELERSGFYLPDFWLPELGCWVEIKGQSPADIEVLRAKELAHAGEQPVLIFYKLEVGTKGGFAHPYLDRYYPNSYAFGECDACSHIDIIDADAHRAIQCSICNAMRLYRFTSPTLRKAFEAARSARFEHGERPVAELLRVRHGR